MDELTRLQNSYNQLKAMGFEHEEIISILDGKGKGALKEITKKEAVDTMVLYFRAKKLLSDSHVQQIIKGNAHLRGAATLPRDVATLFAYESFVDALERTEVLKGVGSGKKEVTRTWENYFAELEQKYERDLRNKGNGTRRQVDTLEEIKKEPFDYRLKDYLNQYMDEQVMEDVAFAINMDRGALAVVRGIPFAAGRTKQESYADVVLKYLYADTAVSREKAKNLELDRLNKDLRKQLSAKGSIETQLTSSEAAILAAIASSSASVSSALTGALTAATDDIKSTMAAYHDDLKGTIITNGRARKREHSNILSAIKTNRVVTSLVGGVLALAILGTAFGLSYDIKNADESSLLNAADAFYSTEADELVRFTEAFNRAIDDGRVSADELMQLRTSRDQFAANDIAGKYSSTPAMDAMIATTSLFEKHDDSQLKPGNFSQIVADADSHARFDAFMDSYNDKTADGLTPDEVTELQSVIDAEPNDELKSHMQSVLNLATNQKTDGPTDYAEQKAKAEYGSAEAAEYSAFMTALQKAKEDGSISQTEYDELAARITAEAANDAYGWNMTGAKTDILDSEFNLSVAQGQVTALNLEITALNDEVNALKAQQTADAAEIARLEGLVADKEARITELEGLLAAGAGSNEVIADLRDQLKTAREELNTAKAEIDTLKARNEELETENSGLKTENDNLKTENDNLKTENDQLKQEVKDLTEEAGGYKADAEKLLQEVTSLKADNKTKADLITGYLAEIESLKADYEDLSAEFETYKSTAVPKSDLDAANQTINSLRETIARLEGEIAAAIREGAANATFLDELYESLSLQTSGELTDAQIREYVAFYLGLNYQENTNGSEADYPSYQ